MATSPRIRRLVLIIPAIVVLLFAGRWLAGFMSDRWWAEGISPHAVQSVTDWALLRLTLESAGVLIACAWCIGHLLLVHHAIGSIQVHRRLANLEIREAVNMRLLVWLNVGGGLLVGWLAGRGLGDWAPMIVLGWHGRIFGEVDPIMGKDLGFYLAQLPLWVSSYAFLLQLVLLALGGVTALYSVIGAIRWQDRRFALNTHARRHLGILAALLALILTGGYILHPYELVAGLGGQVTESGFALQRTVSSLLTGIALAAAVLSGWWVIRGRNFSFALIWILLLVTIVCGRVVAPAMLDDSGTPLVGMPARQQLERAAYGMTALKDSVLARRDAPIEPPRPAALWSPEAALSATAADSGRPVAIDRAVVQVGGRPRPAWVVLRSQGVRGAALTVLLDDQATSTGFPIVFHEADSLVTPRGVPPLRLPRRAIWPGHSGAIIDSAGGGVRLGVGLRRLALGWALQSGRILGAGASDLEAFSYLDPVERLSRLAPFAVWGTPVPRLIGGELVWLVDGYLPVETYPGTSRVVWREVDIGGLQAGFIGVISAISGQTTIYLRHTASDLAKEWQVLSDSLIQSASAMPSTIARALAYPGELLEVQLRVLQTPHWGMGRLLGRTEQVAIGGPHPDSRWEPDTSGVEQIVPFEGDQQRMISSIVQARVVDGWEVISALRIDSLLALPSPALLQTRWSRFATFQQIKDSVEKTGTRFEPGPVHYWPTAEGLGAYQAWFAERDGTAPAVLWVNVAVGDRLGAGRDVEESWQNLLGLSAPTIDPGERGAMLFEARRHMLTAEAALKRGDLEAFARAWEALKRVLRAP